MMPTLLPTSHVTKANELVEASYKLSLIEQRLILYAIAWAREYQAGLTARKPLRIEAKSFSDRFPDTDPQNVYRDLATAVDRLFGREIIIKHVDTVTGKPAVTRTRWISSATYIDGAGTVALVFSEEVLPFLTRLEERYTQYRLSDVVRLTSTYAIRLYELLMQFKSTGWREINIMDFRSAMGLSDNEYSLLTNLQARVLKPAVKQINELTGYDVVVEPVKAAKGGRTAKVTGFRFFFGPKN